MRGGARSVMPIRSPISRTVGLGSFAMQSSSWPWLVRKVHFGVVSGTNQRLTSHDLNVMLQSLKTPTERMAGGGLFQVCDLQGTPLHRGEAGPPRSRSVPRLRRDART